MARWYAYCALGYGQYARAICALSAEAEHIERVEESGAITPDMGIILVNADLVDSPQDNPPEEQA